MSETGSEFKIGIIVLMALGILLFGIIWGKQVYLTTGSYSVDVRFRDIAGLEQGAQVLVNGVRRGKVKALILKQDAVIVRLALQKSVILYNDAHFEVTTPELMGGKVINIFPGISGVKPEENFVFTGEVGGGMNELMKMSTELVEDVRHLLNVLEVTAQNINMTAGDPRLREAFLSSINNLDESSERTLEFITLNEGKLTQVMDNLVYSTEKVRDLLETNADQVSGAVADFDQFIAQLNDLASRLNDIAAKLQSEEGSLGMLINDEKFADKLKGTLTDLDSLVQQIREEGIHTQISLFGRRRR